MMMWHKPSKHGNPARSSSKHIETVLPVRTTEFQIAVNFVNPGAYVPSPVTRPGPPELFTVQSRIGTLTWFRPWTRQEESVMGIHDAKRSISLWKTIPPVMTLKWRILINMAKQIGSIYCSFLSPLKQTPSLLLTWASESLLQVHHPAVQRGTWKQDGDDSWQDWHFTGRTTLTQVR